MSSTFMGLETAKRALTAQQHALQTTGHNIANANTPGFTRQRVDLQQSDAFSKAGMNQPSTPGQMGTGVDSNTVARIRDQYLDVQYRGENAKLGYWETKNENLSRMEDLMNEPTDEGVANAMDEFWKSLQDLSANPEDSGARSVVRQRGEAMVDTFSYISNSLQANKTDLDAQIDNETGQFNSLLSQISSVNEQIAGVEPHGKVPNDLYDERDRLIDELSSMATLEVKRNPSGGNANSNAEGTVDIFMTSDTGERLQKLVDGNALAYQEVSVEKSAGRDGHVETASFEWANGKAGTNITNPSDSANAFMQSSGSMQGLHEAYGYMDEASGEVEGLYTDMLDSIDTMVTTFANALNETHREGWTMNDVEAGTKGAGVDFFSFDPAVLENKGAASALRVSEDVKADLNNIAAATESENGTGYAGNGSNALNLANVKDADLNFGENGENSTSVQRFYQGVIGQMAVDASEANQKTNITQSLTSSADERRMSVSGVSMDEEMANMIQFQHAYNAASRSVTTFDEMLDRIINNMGLVGR